MNIQVFGKAKSFDTKKAERFFKERKIPFQRIELEKKGLSPGEYQSVKRAVGGLDPLLDKSCKAYETLFIAHLAYEADQEAALLEHPALFAAPIVRNGRQATVGFCPEVWEQWVEANKK